MLDWIHCLGRHYYPAQPIPQKPGPLESFRLYVVVQVSVCEQRNPSQRTQKLLEGSDLDQFADSLEHQVVSSIDHTPAAHLQGEVEGGVPLVPKVLGQSLVPGSFSLQGSLEEFEESQGTVSSSRTTLAGVVDLSMMTRSGI